MRARPEAESWFDSPVGPVRSVAPRVAGHHYFRSTIWLWNTLFFSIAAFLAWAELNRFWTVGFAVLAAWQLLFALKWLGTAHSRAVFLRAGPGGLAWSEPAIGLIAPRLRRGHRPWSDIQTWYVDGEKDGRLTVTRKLALLLKEGGRIDVELLGFWSPREELSRNIEAAARAAP